MNDTSLFRQALGPAFDTLAPALRRHYDLAPGQSVSIEGRMRAWNRYPVLRLFIPFMPVPGDNLRVVVRNRGLIDRGEVCYEWQRFFHYPKRALTTYTLTRPATGVQQPAVLDTFNQPPNIAVTLALSVLDEGSVLQQINSGPQFALFGTRKLALPGFMQVRSLAVERALDERTVRTEVEISHPLLGPMFGYVGELTLS
jgi:Domain of unknown function (DUF4166)